MNAFRFLLFLALVSVNGSSLGEETVAEPILETPIGMVTYGIRLPDRSVRVGDKLDVLLFVKTPDGATKTEFVLRNVQVLTVDKAVARNGQLRVVCIAGLAVSLQDALVVYAAEKRGEVKLCSNRLD